jgi:hypothetical protein
VSERGQPAAGTTPFPNHLLDEVRPRLKGSEWNVLCLIVRQTCGWTDRKGLRKQQDWLTHRQIKQKTGLASASICQAISTLVESGLITVRDGQGTVLEMAAERRRAGRLYFALGSCRYPHSPTKRVVGPWPFQKSKTTQGAKEKIDTFVVFENQNRGERDTSISDQLPATDLTPATLAGDLGNVVRHYRDGFQSHFGNRQLPAIFPADFAALKTLVDKIGPTEVKRRLDSFLDCEYRFVTRQHYSLNAFTHSANFFIPAGRLTGAQNRQVLTTP